MFGHNEIVGKSYFKNEPAGTLVVTSIFYTLQGEGPYSGMPCVFVRLSKCNLACSFCDTQFDIGQRMTFDELRGKIYSAICDHWGSKEVSVPLWVLPDNIPRRREDEKLLGPYGLGLVITGGEPTLQANLKDFLEYVADDFKWIQIESNGIVSLELGDHVTRVVSPKCAEKEGRATQYLKPSQFMLDNADCLKFVMCAPILKDPNTSVDSAPSPYEEVPDWAHEWAAKTGKPVYVSPMNVYKSVPQKMKMFLSKKDKTIEERSTVDEVVSFWEPGVLDMEANRRNHEHAARYAITHGFRFQVQAHLYAGLA